MRANYHSHTRFSDGKFTPELYISQALQKEFIAYGFSDHAPFPGVNTHLQAPHALQDYLDTIESLKTLYKGRIEIYASLEIDYYPGKISLNDEIFSQLPLDYTIGSVHFLENPSADQPWGIENTVENFQFGLEKIFTNDVQYLIETYFARVREMIQFACPTIVAHIDRIKRHNFSLGLFDETEDWYRKAALETLDLLAETDAIMEINTKGYYSLPNADLYPSAWIIQEAFKRNIPVHVSSDTHHPRYVDGGFAHANKILLASGYKTQRVLLQGNWQDVAFSERGMHMMPQLV